MKILMTTDTVGGVWTYCMDLCRSLHSYPVQIYLVTMGRRISDWQWKEVLALENVVVYETCFQLEWMQDPWSDIEECGEWLLQVEEDIQPDLIHLNCFAYGALPFKAPVLVVAHSDVWSWFLAVKGEEPPQEWKRYFHCVRKGLTGAGKVVAPSTSMLNAVREIYGVEAEVIYNGRENTFFYERNKKSSVFSMGRIWDEAKNTKLLVEAAPKINADIRIAGDNQFAQNSFDTSAGNVHFLGKLATAQVAEELSSAAIYVLPAKYEPFGLSALEAALSGCALVLGDIPSLREIWKDAAIYVETDNADQLAGAINTLLKDKDRLQELRYKARRQASHYSIEATTKSYWNLYQQLQKESTIFIKTTDRIT